MGTVIASDATTESFLSTSRSSVIPRHKLVWSIAGQRPSGWSDMVRRCGGGFFHTPAGAQSVIPAGDLLFAQLRHGTDLVGVAVGARVGCGLSLSSRHVFFPTTPAIALPSRREAAVKALRETLRREGCAELEMDTHDARFEPGLTDGADVLAVRMEYLVTLHRQTEQMRRRLSPDHLRCISQGDAAGWRLTLTGASSSSSGSNLALTGHDGAAMGFSAAAWQEDALLAQLQVGVAGRRAYCRKSQASPAGREAGAMTWLQWQVMCQLAEHDVAVYNLGTAPPAAASDLPGQDPLRARMGFSPEMVRCRRVRWVLSPGHMRAHKVMGWFGRQSA